MPMKIKPYKKTQKDSKIEIYQLHPLTQTINSPPVYSVVKLQASHYSKCMVSKFIMALPAPN